MTIYLNISVLESRARVLSTALDADTLPGQLKIYSGTQPAGGGTPTGTLLVTLTFPKPSADTFSGGTLVLKEPNPGLAAADGLATWARLEDGGGNWVADCSVGATGSGHPVIINAATADIYAGGTVTVDAITVTEV